MWCCSIHPVSPATVFCCVYLIFGHFFTPPVSTNFFTGIDLIAAFYGCLYAGCVPVNVRPPHPQNLAATLPTVRMIIDVCLSTLLQTQLQNFALTDFVFLQVSKAACILTTQHLTRILRSKEAAASVNIKTWPTIIDTGMCFFKKCLLII